ncbi:fimbrial assembly protein [Pistricoccus aurantiacus]|uniref:Fimbrial assembly protein n=1 Tax=Pistricoccus aurantiacus TaxID=1883414 RepID=A0A5B8SP40_9GAMM|nr:PilN domain-containing protein [Pistricoccus aurantiacus]QEA37964.1 fimbrial assembly protein [Pistricoccus aurantiacus]
MSIEINLLPWREAARARRGKHFCYALGLMALLGLGGGFLMSLYYAEGLDGQQQRNDYLQRQSRLLDQEIGQVREYEKKREQMLEQIEVFTALQFARPQTVQVLNQLTTSLQEGVHYTRLERQQDTLRLEGLAEINRQVSDQLRSLEATSALEIPVLSEVESTAEGYRRFALSVAQHEAMGETP